MKKQKVQILFRAKSVAPMTEVEYALMHGAKLGRDESISGHYTRVQRVRSANINQPGRVCGNATKKVNGEVSSGGWQKKDAWVQREARAFRNPGPVLPCVVFK